MAVQLEAGTSIAHYRVIGAIGAGGMGEVYRARDSKLDRDVALKILSTEAFRDHERVVRFVNEAKAASSLNHPNIITIHEIGEAALPSSPPIHYIAMELIDGLTLGSRIHDRDVPLKTLLAELAQTADGLAKAHAAGIVHRDLKPENIMVTRDGYAKVLDFGLAKLTVTADSDRGPASVAPTERHTREGTVMGTVGYMSPEQVSGQAVDHRSDIFSFGCILYEAVTRRRPFPGHSDIDVMHKILYDEAAAVEQFAPSTPAVLRRLIRRCLIKDREQRLQSMKDIAFELHDIVNEFEQLSPTDSSSVPSLRRRPRWPWMIAAVLAASIVAVAVWQIANRPGRVASAPAAVHAEAMRIERVTNIGQVHGAALSRDGKYVAYTVWEPQGKSSLFIRQLATSTDARVAGPIAGRMWRVRYSPDGAYLYYVVIGTPQTVYRVPSVGGPAQKIVSDSDTTPAFSADGSKFAFVRRVPQRHQSLIQLANSDGSGERTIATLPLGQFYPMPPDWSPDGRSVVAAVPDARGGRLCTVDVGTGARQPFGPAWVDIDEAQWLPDGSALIACGRLTPTGRWQLWLQPYPSGQPRTLITEPEDYVDVTMTADARTLSAVRATESGRVTVSAGKPGDEVVLIPDSPDEQVTHLSASAANLMALQVLRGGKSDVWITDIKAGTTAHLTSDGQNYFPLLSGDGKTILFSTMRGGGVPHVWRMDADGSNLRQLTHGAYEVAIGMPADASWYLYQTKSEEVWKANASGGATRFSDPVDELAVSPDGKWVAERYTANGKRRLRVVSSAGRELRLDVDFEHAWEPEWLPGGAGVTYVKTTDGVSNIFLQPLSGGEPRRLTSFSSDAIDNYAWLPDGRIALSRIQHNYDAVLITDFR